MMNQINDGERFLGQIAMFQHCSSIIPIHKGYSSDAKYVVYDHFAVPVYLLRTYHIDQDREKQMEFRTLEMMEELGIQCSRPVEIGVLPDYELGYMIVSYIDGEDASDVLPRLTTEEQFSIGVQAGTELKAMHQLAGPELLEPWSERMAAKHRRYRTAYAECGVTIKQDEKLLSYIDEHLFLMNDRPNRFQHDDFHISNLIVKNGKLSGVIDFNRYDWGDPIHEFVKVGMFSSEISVPFSAGQIRGYHAPKEPDNAFWQLYALYLAMTLISSVVWILKVRPGELDSMVTKIERVMDDHDDFAEIVPKWYRQYLNGSTTQISGNNS